MVLTDFVIVFAIWFGFLMNVARKELYAFVAAYAAVLVTYLDVVVNRIMFILQRIVGEGHSGEWNLSVGSFGGHSLW